MNKQNKLLAEAIHQFDEANAQDPNREMDAGISVPRELLYAQRMSAMLQRFFPVSSEALQLAVRCQHLQRWLVPRSDFPEGRIGYHRWRRHLAEKHAEDAGVILSRLGYDPHMIARVQQLVRKVSLKTDPETQTLEDVACLVFLTYYAYEFQAKHGREKLRDVVSKSWRKMSEVGRKLVDQLELNDEIRDRLQECREQTPPGVSV